MANILGIDLDKNISVTPLAMTLHLLPQPKEQLFIKIKKNSFKKYKI